MIRRFLTAWAAWQALKDLGDPFDIPEWPDAPDQLATPYIPQEPR
ncbi:hypothetical protein [Microbispora sp. CA-102843]